MLEEKELVSKYCSVSLAYGKEINTRNALISYPQIEYKSDSSRFRYNAVSFLCKRKDITAAAVVPIPYSGVFLASCWTELRSEKFWPAFGYNEYDTSIFYTTDDYSSRRSHCETKVGVLTDLKKIYKDVILIDEAILSGVTMETAIQSLRKNGVERIHAVTILPPFINKCPYSVISYTPTLDLNTDIAKVIGADSFSCLSLSELASLYLSQPICFECQKTTICN